LPVFTAGREDGFTMVELMVGLTVLAVGIVGVIGVMNSGFGVTARNNQRTKAIALATQAVEATRATDWATLTRPDNPAHPEQGSSSTYTSGGYTVQRAVLPASDGTQNVTVDVQWTDGAGAHDVNQTSKVYPGNLGPTGAAASSPSSAPLTAPTGLLASVPTDNAGGTVVDLSWTNPVQENPLDSYLTVVWSVDDFATVHTVTDRLFHRASSLRVTGLSAGTTYKFKVAALSAAGALSSWSPATTVTTAAAAGTTCSYGSSSVSPSQTLLLTKQAGTGVWSASIPMTNGLDWSPGVHQLSLLDALQTPQGTLSLTVCAFGSSSCA
jgi:prepilin-type N-terminal cleavage/methylation domain-containing protein